MNLLLQGQHLGLPSDYATAGASRALSAAATWQAYSFIARGAIPDTITLWQTTKTGSPAASDIQLCLCADNGSGIPNHGTIIESRTATSIPATSGRLAFSGWTTTLTEGAQYWVFVRNNNATPASNNVTVAYGAAGLLAAGRYAANAVHGWGCVATLNSGTAWATNATTRASAMMITYPSSVIEGIPQRGFLRGDQTATTNRIYGTREGGFEFGGLTSGITYNVRAAYFIIQRVGTITSVRAKLYNAAGTLLATSRAVVNAQLSSASTGAGVLFEFTSTVGLTSAAGPYRCVLETVGGDASNYVQFGWLQVFDTSSDVLGLAPMGGTWCRTLTSDNTAGPIVWTDTTDEWPVGSIVLDPTTPYTVASGFAFPLNGVRSAL